jgi:hypothetical protein
MGSYCNSGACTCNAPGDIICGGVCIGQDSSNCGGCGMACPTGGFFDIGMSQCDCPPGESICGGACVNLSSDSNNCGACGMTCTSPATCSSGACSM